MKLIYLFRCGVQQPVEAYGGFSAEGLLLFARNGAIIWMSLDRATATVEPNRLAAKRNGRKLQLGKYHNKAKISRNGLFHVN